MQRKIYTNNGGGGRSGFTLRRNVDARSGFTLIEILIVVAIISILASIVLVGIGPTEQLGRDARRVSDLHQVQTALELYYAKCGNYPGPAVNDSVCQAYLGLTGGYGENGANPPAATSLIGSITASDIGVKTMPNDPQKNKKYYYATEANGVSYILGAILENKNGSVFSGYIAPATTLYTDGKVPPTTGCGSPNFFLTL